MVRLLSPTAIVIGDECAVVLTLLRRTTLKWIEKHGRNVTGSVLNVGSANDPYNYKKYFPNASRYRNLDIVHQKGVHINADVRDMPLPSDSEDCITAVFMIYHLRNVREALREFKRVLRQNSILLITYQPSLPPISLETEDGGIITSITTGPWRVAGKTVDGVTALKSLDEFFHVDEVLIHREKNGCEWLLIKAVNRGG